MQSSDKINGIPQFSLYGESAHRNLIDFVHIEDIYYRSARNDWVIKPHRHNTLFQILFISSGNTRVILDDEANNVRGSCLITIPVGVVHGFQFEPDTKGVVLSLAINQQGLDVENQLGPLFSEDMSQAHVLKLVDDTSTKFIAQCLDEIRNELTDIRRDHSLALFSLVKLVLLNIRRKVLSNYTTPVAPRQELLLSERFRQLVEKHFHEHWNIASYAEHMHVSASTLNRACVRYLGISAKKFLQERMHTEAKRLLIYTSENLDTITSRLGYKDAGYFSRVFRNQEGCSPRDFRKKMKERIDLVINSSL